MCAMAGTGILDYYNVVNDNTIYIYKLFDVYMRYFCIKAREPAKGRVVFAGPAMREAKVSTLVA